MESGIVLGNAKFLAEFRTRRSALDMRAQAEDYARMAQQRSSWQSMDASAGVIAIADPVKPTTLEALRGLKAEGMRVVMLTGDNWTTAEAVARRLGIDEVEAEVLPDQKSAVVQTLQGDRPGGGDGGRRRQ